MNFKEKRAFYLKQEAEAKAKAKAEADAKEKIDSAKKVETKSDKSE